MASACSRLSSSILALRAETEVVLSFSADDFAAVKVSAATSLAFWSSFLRSSVFFAAVSFTSAMAAADCFSASLSFSRHNSSTALALSTSLASSLVAKSALIMSMSLPKLRCSLSLSFANSSFAALSSATPFATASSTAANMRTLALARSESISALRARLSPAAARDLASKADWSAARVDSTASFLSFSICDSNISISSSCVACIAFNAVSCVACNSAIFSSCAARSLAVSPSQCALKFFSASAISAVSLERTMPSSLAFSLVK